MNSENLLKIVLRLVGATCILALGGLFMPTSWMALTHEWLGLGELPRAPIVDYLARSLSAFYAILGGMLILLSRDVRRHAAPIAYLAVMGLIFSVVIYFVDVAAGLPTWWSVGEALTLIPVCIVILVLQRNIRRASVESTPRPERTVRG